MIPQLPVSEFSRPVALEDNGARPLRFTVEATPSECAALAKRFDLVRLDRLVAEGIVTPRTDGAWRLTGGLSAAVVQSCVITLEPVASDVTDRFEIDFAPANETTPVAELHLVGEDCEPLPPDGKLDVGEIVAQQLSLALDPFPRRPGASWNSAVGPEELVAEGRRNPLAGLADRLGKPRDP